MTVSIFLQFVVMLAAIWMGARSSGVGLGLWGAVGLLVLMVVFGVNPTSPPIDVMLIILAVIMAASVMDAAGGIDFLVRIAEGVIRANPKYVTIVAPLTTWSFTFVAGTGHIIYPLLPVIYETAHQSGVRPERPMAVATIASQQAITASPVAAATAAMIGLFSEKGLTQWGLPQILMICVPATLTGVVAAAIISMFVGKDLKDDPEYQARLASGAIPPPKAASERPPLKPAATMSAVLLLIGVALVVLFGFFPALRQLSGAKAPLAMPIVIEIVMLSVAAVMLVVAKVPVDEVPKTATLRAGVVAVIGFSGSSTRCSRAWRSRA
jgi:anaerobic C4-dicarboxylate transporter DcuA